MKIPKNLTQVFHLTPSDLFSQFWREPIHIGASVFATLSFSPETFSKQSSNTNKARAESKSDKTTVVSSVNCSSLVSKSFIIIPLISWFFFVFLLIFFYSNIILYTHKEQQTE